MRLSRWWFCAVLAAVGVGVAALLLFVPGTGASSGGDRFVQSDDGTRVTFSGVGP